MRNLLVEKDGYRVTHEYEQTFVEWPGGELEIGNHYGDPVCAVLDAEAGLCVIGGEGLCVTKFRRTSTANGTALKDLEHSELWRWQNPREHEPCWFVTHLELRANGKVRATVDAGGAGDGVYEVDTRTLEWRRA